MVESPFYLRVKGLLYKHKLFMVQLLLLSNAYYLLKCYYEEDNTFSIEATLRQEKCCLLFSNISFCSRDIQDFKICKFPWQHTGFHTSPILRALVAALCVQLSYLQMIYMIQQAYKYVSLSLWPHIQFFELKITCILKSGGWEPEKSDLPWQQNVS